MPHARFFVEQKASGSVIGLTGGVCGIGTPRGGDNAIADNTHGNGELDIAGKIKGGEIRGIHAIGRDVNGERFPLCKFVCNCARHARCDADVTNDVHVVGLVVGIDGNRMRQVGRDNRCR